MPVSYASKLGVIPLADVSSRHVDKRTSANNVFGSDQSLALRLSLYGRLNDLVWLDIGVRGGI